METTTTTDNATKQEEKKEDESAAVLNRDIHTPVGVKAAVKGSSTSSASHNPKAPPLQKPSYYIDSYHEHFFPHDYDPAVDASTLPPRKKLSLPQRYATSMARRPWTHLVTALVLALLLSFIGFRFGDFTVAIDNAGWWSRGTQIANRATQEIIVLKHRQALFSDTTGEVWEELRTVVQPNWEAPAPAAPSNGTEEVEAAYNTISVCAGEWYGSPDMLSGSARNLFPVWKTEDADSENPQRSALDADALHDMCVAEENTLNALRGSGACQACPATGNCVAPYSLVLLARFHLTGNDISELSALSETVSCDNLRSSWTDSVQRSFTTALKTCVNWSVRMVSSNGNTTITVQDTSITITNPCPFPIRFSPTVVDELFATRDPPVVRYSSSIYATKHGKEDLQGMFDANQKDAYDRGDGAPLAGVYETTGEDFSEYYTDSILGRDMTLAVGSAGVTVLAMIVHTRSPFLTFMGLCQILLSFPLAYFVYYFFGGLVFFPFLNFIGIFVVFALGADDVFVAVDKWKNARRELPHGTTEQVAALALPDAAYSMLLTSATTAVAFFGTAICPVGPIVCFAVFCGLLITLDYLMNILLVFPALCLYDKWMLAGSQSCCVNFDWCCRRTEEGTSDSGGSNDVEGQVGENAVTFASGRAQLGAEQQTLMERILNVYYTLLHKFRWLVLVIAIAATIACTVFALQISQPLTSKVSLLPDSNEYSLHTTWKKKLLSYQLVKEENEARILWGLKPADTGDHLDPSSWTTLVLDETFDPTSQESQTYLLQFCDRLFAAFGSVSEEYECPIVAWHEWLQEQSSSDTPTDAYTQNCAGASFAPVPAEVFNPCIIAWSQLHDVTSVLQTDDSVKILEVRARSILSEGSPQTVMKKEWTDYEEWLDNERTTLAPSGVDRMYHTDLSYWWFDVNQQMLKTAIGAMGIALACASVIIFISSRSFVLTIFAAISVLYVLAAATASLVGLGWDLGFLESVLFAILIGISCDFVIHVGHAYTMYSGNVDRSHRSQFALTHMGPSIIAAAFTTFMAAVVMIFTEITFFRKFAVILFMTILHSVIGCFVVFLVLCDCFGPAEPTKTYDAIKSKMCGRGQKVGEIVSAPI